MINSFKRVGSAVSCAVGERYSLKEAVVRDATSFLKPFPNVAIALRAITRRAAGHDVGRLGEAAESHRDYMIPSRCARVTICALAVEFFEERRSGAFWNGRHATLPQLRPMLSSQAKVLIRSIAQTGIGIRAWLTFTRMDAGDGKPLFASAAPQQAVFAVLAPCADVWTRLNATCFAAGPTDIAATVASASVNDKRRYRPKFSAERATLFAVLSARNVALVGRPARLCSPSHGAHFTQIRERRKQTRDGREHNEFPAAAKAQAA
jgi:hypothetical protein